MLAATAAFLADSSVPLDPSVPAAPLRLHLPKTSTISESKLFDLDAITPEAITDALLGWRYINDITMYKDVPLVHHRSVQKSIITTSQTQQLFDAGLFTLVDDLSSVKGSVFVFAIQELTKFRERAICHPVKPNNFLPVPPKISFNTISWRKQLVNKGSHAIVRDFKGFYNQFVLSDDVSDFYCAKLPFAVEGSDKPVFKLCRLTRAPTGLSTQVYTAVATMNLLSSFSMHSAAHDDQIDDKLFVGTKEAVIRDARVFQERCLYAGVDIKDKDDDLESLARTECDWLGMRLSFTDKTVCCLMTFPPYLCFGPDWYRAPFSVFPYEK